MHGWLSMSSRAGSHMTTSKYAASRSAIASPLAEELAEASQGGQKSDHARVAGAQAGHPLSYLAAGRFSTDGANSRRWV